MKEERSYQLAGDGVSLSEKRGKGSRDIGLTRENHREQEEMNTNTPRVFSRLKAGLQRRAA